MQDYQVVALMAQRIMQQNYEMGVESARAGGPTEVVISVDDAVELAFDILNAAKKKLETDASESRTLRMRLKQEPTEPPQAPEHEYPDQLGS